jgi:hypothetical protein
MGPTGVAGDDSFTDALRVASAGKHIELNTTKPLVTGWAAADSVYPQQIWAGSVAKGEQNETLASCSANRSFSIHFGFGFV